MSRIQELRTRIKAFRDAIEKTPANGTVVVSATISTAGNSQSWSGSPKEAREVLAGMKAELSRLLAGGRFVRGRIVHDFGG